MIDKRRSRREALHRALGASRAIIASSSELETAIRAALDADVEGGVQQVLQDAPPLDPHRLAHRPGRTAKLAADPELRAFVEARLGAMTFDQIAAEVAATFPPDRRVRRSAIHAWWTKHHKRIMRAGPG